MATSLAEQLQRLAVPQTSILTRDKKRPSLLFDQKEAATLSRETIYQIGLEGLEELVQKNETFAQFEHTLFHLTSKQFERSVQTAEANEKLNRSLKKFLLLSAPYFMLNSCHKTLEWLINRFSIHEYNRDDLLLLSLPYHESNIFVRVIQLFKFKDTRDSFYFLKLLQKPGAHLPKQSLLNHAASNSGFLKVISKYIKDLLKHHEKPEILTVAFNFYCTIFTGTIELSDKITEDQVSQMLPMLLKGLNSTVADFCAGSYVITARLVSKTSFSDKLLDKFVEKISEVPVPTLKTEAILVLLVIYQSQSQYRSIPQVATANLSEKLWLPKTLYNLQSSGSFIYPFLEIILKNFAYEGVNNDFKLAREMIKACLDYIKVKDTFVATVLSCILDAVPAKMDISSEAKEWLTEIFESIENQYPCPFDKEIYKILSVSTNKTSIKRRKSLSKILKNTTTYQGKFDIFNKLYHPNPAIRTEALTFLLDDYDSLRDNYKEIINNSFVDRLRDDDVTVVKNTLKVIKKTGIMDRENLKSSLIHLTEKYQKDKDNWDKVCSIVLEMLTTLYPPNDWEVFLTVFPFLLPTDSQDLGKAKEVLNSPFLVGHDLFKNQILNLKSINDRKTFVKVVTEALDENTDVENVKSFIEMLKKIPDESWNTFKKYVSFLILSHLLPKNSSLKTGNIILDILLTFYKSSEVKFEQTSTIDVYIKQALLGKFPIRGFLICLENLTKKIEKPKLTVQDFSLDHTENKFILMITIILVDNNEDFLKTLLHRYCQNLEEEIEFLLNLCINKKLNLEDDFKQKVLRYIQRSLKNNEETKPLIFLDKRISAFLIVLLSDPNAEIREEVIDIINTLIDVSSRKTVSYYHLLNYIVKNKEEVIIDNEQLPSIMFNHLDYSNTKKKTCTNDLNIIRNRLLKLCYDNVTPCYLKAGILKALSLITSFDILEDLSDMAVEILKNSGIEGIRSFNAKIIGFVVSRIESKVIKKLKLDSSAWKLIETFIKDDKTKLYNEDEAQISPSLLVLNQLDKEFFSELENEIVVKKLIDLIIEISTTARDPEVLPAASKIFKHIDLNADCIKEQLVAMREVQSPKLDESKRKRRIGVVPTADILDTLEWRKGVTILEFIQDKKKIRNSEMIVPIFFDLLKRCLDFDEQSAVEYPKQLLLSIILHCCTKIEAKIPENVFNVELIVQCIRASQNPQTHHHALLVLAHTAHNIPNQVLHNIMAIFTFIGSSVLRHDDAYSFQIISKIVDTIIPIIVSSDEEENKIQNISNVLRVFVDVILDVPEHRRIPLYKQLLEQIEVNNHLHLFLLLIFEAQVTHGAHDKQRKENSQKRLDIAAELCRQFSPEIVIANCISLIKYLNKLPDEKEENMEIDNDVGTIFNIASHTPKDFRHYKYVLVKSTGNLLSSPEFVNQIASLSDEDELTLEPLFKEMIVNTLQYIQRISKVSDKASNTPQAHYWKVLLHLSYDILDSVNALLTPQMFLLVTKGLMIHTLSTVRRRVLELLNNKLQHNSQFFEECSKNELYSLIRPIITIIQGLDEEVDAEQETIIQTALLSLKLLVKLLARQEPEKFVQILDFITGVLKSGKAQNNVLASVVLCLAELCIHLKGHAIASLPDFMPILIKILKQQKHEEVSSVLLKSLITTIEKILNSMPLFLSPYLEKLLIEVSQLMSKWNLNKDEQKVQQLSTKLNSIKQKIGTTIPLRILLLPIENCYNTLVARNYFHATSSLLNILAESITNTNGLDVNSNLNELTNFFLNILKFRTEQECTLEAANMVESHIVKALTVLILKLSENTFRPLYYKLYDWAARSDVKTERLITFYNLSSKIAQSLKGLFVLFAGHFINNVAAMLDACNKVKTEELYFDDQEKNILLLQNILSTLDAVFLYDNHKFVNRDRFDILMQPLVDQLENPLGGLDELIKRNNTILTPCLVNFSVAVADDALWKQMNYQILLKMRHNSPKIRLVTLHCVTEIVKKLGEDFLPLLPETIPFLAELLEDEEEDVEKACQKAIQEMEKVLGEPLQKYF
ncbi:HEAT repeat-containing protein 1 [Diabrotica undecimpunctata]|uniref:HEAT repeat-containing protein 1 n=1 Tax=Diabrotica undecimpunctata TaxID=50387 RepID=UPI003B6417C2